MTATRAPSQTPAVFSTEPTPVATLQPIRDRKSTRLNSSHGYISYAVFCLKKKKNKCKESSNNKGMTYMNVYSAVIISYLNTQGIKRIETITFQVIHDITVSIECA